MYIEKFLKRSSGITKADVEQLCGANIEQLYLEIKETVDDPINNLLKPFVAFANAKGGLLILGISDANKLVVDLDTSWNEQKITNIIRDCIFPSVAGYFQIIKTSDANCYLIDVEPTTRIVGIKPAKGMSISKYPTYLYFVRNAHESKQIDPPLMQQVVTGKADYAYNEDYRNQILNRILEAEGTYRWFGKWNSDDADSEMVKAVKSYQTDTGILTTKFEELKGKIRNCQLKTLSINIIESFIGAYGNIIEVRTRVKHTANLTIAEDDALNELQDEFCERVGVVRRPANQDQVNSVLYEQRNKGFRNVDNLSLLGCTNYYADVLLKPFIKNIGDKNIVYDLPIDKPLIGLLMSYDDKLNNLTKAISELCDSYAVPTEIKDDVIDRISNEFPDRFLKDYLSIMGCFEKLKAATRKALYLEWI